MKTATALRYLQDLWDEKQAAGLDEPELLRYRSNLLGADLRITNFAGGNTSSKITMADPLTSEPVNVLWVKGSGGDLGIMRRSGLATLYLDKLRALESSYRGVEEEDAMVALYPLCTFGVNPVAPCRSPPSRLGNCARRSCQRP
jgi:rhamnose utilization protein RhaD (predicted bifunctional aldolase and dehydrogenase)